MLEAMATGLPIITCRCEGVAELVRDNGIIVENPAVEDIAEAIEYLAANRRGYSVMSAASRMRAMDFTWSAVAGQYLKRYKNILNGKDQQERKSICAV